MLGTTLLGSDHQFPDQLGKHFASPGVLGRLAMLDIGPLAMTGHVNSPSFIGLFLFSLFLLRLFPGLAQAEVELAQLLGTDIARGICHQAVSCLGLGKGDDVPD